MVRPQASATGEERQRQYIPKGVLPVSWEHLLVRRAHRVFLICLLAPSDALGTFFGGWFQAAIPSFDVSSKETVLVGRWFWCCETLWNSVEMVLLKLASHSRCASVFLFCFSSFPVRVRLIDFSACLVHRWYKNQGKHRIYSTLPPKIWDFSPLTFSGSQRVNGFIRHDSTGVGLRLEIKDYQEVTLVSFGLYCRRLEVKYPTFYPFPWTASLWHHFIAHNTCLHLKWSAFNI